MPYKDPEKRKEYARGWAAKKAANASPAWHKRQRGYKAKWKRKKGKAYFRRKYREWIEGLDAAGKLEAFRTAHAESTKGWRNRIFLEVLEEIRKRCKPPEPPPPKSPDGYIGILHAIS